MAILNLKSYEQILTDMLNSLQSRVGLSDDSIGSITLSFLETAAQSDFLINSNILAALDSVSIDRANGAILDNLGFAETITRVPASKSSGAITISDTSFSKISTQIYSNRPPPITGATAIYLNNGSSFPANGSVYVGRGTAAVEGPIAYSSVTQIGGYYQMVLAAALSKNHNTGESVILAQGGNRVIASGSALQTPASGSSAQITFNTINSSAILDGETSVTGVSVLCTQTGTVGNIPANILTVFNTLPFPNAAATNASPFSNATDIENDFNYRERIKNTRQARGLGTDIALINSVVNIIAPDEQKRLSSAAVEPALSIDLPTILRIDDGTAYEPIFSGIGNEIILDSALGGENVLQLNNLPVVKAQLTTINTQPFAIYDDYKLSVLVGNVLSEHAFQSSDFRTPGAATTYEVVASINANSELLFSARTASGGTKVVIVSKSDSNEDLEITIPESGTDANNLLSFPSIHAYTLLLYKNNNLLVKDGTAAEIESSSYPWNLSLTSYTLVLSTDNTPYSTYTFNSTNLSPYTPSNATLSAWVSAVNNTVPGVSAISRNNLLVISSNKGFKSTAALSISTSSTLVSIANIFPTLSDTGADSDYSLIRGSGQIKLTTPAVSSDNFQTGTANFQGYVQTDAISGGIFNLSATGNVWLITDSATTQISNNVVIGTTITTSNPSTNIWRFAGPASCFANVAVGDWAVAWDESLSASNKGYWRVANSSDTFIDVEKSTGFVQTASITNNNSFVTVRSSGLIEQAYLPSGSYALATAVDSLNGILIGATASVVDTNKLRISTNTYLSNGFIALLTADTNGQAIGFDTFTTKTNGNQHVAAIESGNSEIGSPLFSLPVIANTTNNSYPVVFQSTIAQTVNPDKMLFFKKPLASTRYSTNRFNNTGIRNILASTTSLTLVNKLSIKEIVTGDRAYFTNGYDFSYDDTLNIVLDDNASTNTLIMPVYREISVNSSPAPNTNSFSATDVDGGNLSLTKTFGSAYDFNNYRLWSRARQIVNSAGTNNAFIIRSQHYGPTGNLYRFSVGYPSTANSALTSFASVTNSFIDNFVTLGSGASKTTGIDTTSQFSLTISNSNPYTVQYIHVAGTAPAFVANGVAAGDILNVPSTSAFSTAAEGTFLITGVSATSITVTNWAYNGVPANQTVTLSSVTDLSIYSLSGNTATTIINLINTGNLNQNITATLASGESGAGFIFRSTNDDSGNTTPYLTLVDGENWVKNATLTASPQFTTEVNLSLTDSVYLPSLVGERFRLIPYTAKQTATFLDSKAISNIGNIGGLETNSQGNKIQINSQQFGTLGAVRATGGHANSAGGSIIGTASTLTSNTFLIRSTQGATEGLHADSWIQISSALPLKKNINFNATASLQVLSTVSLTISGGTTAFNTANAHSGNATTQIQVEKIGKFAVYIYNSGTAPAFSNAEGDWAYILSSSTFNNNNLGIFRIIRSSSTSFWIENENAVEETVTLTGNTDIQFYTSDSIMPGDSLILSGGILNSANDGTYIVSQVAASSLTVSVLTPFATTTASTLLSNNFNNVKSFDAKTTNFYKQIYTLQNVSSFDSDLVDIILKSSNSTFDLKISDVYECTFVALNKLNFNTKTFFGIDSYLVYEGLIKEANRIIRGDPKSPLTYPGVKSTGSYVDIQPPLPRKITMSIGVRLRTGVAFKTIENNIKSIVAGIINSTNIGTSIAPSDISGAIRGVQGVFAVSIIYPVFDAENDIIIIHPSEKPICDASTDVSVTLLGS